MLGSVVEPQEWLTRAGTRIEEAATGTLEKSEAGRELVKLVTDKLAALQSRCTAAIASVAQMEGLTKYADYLTALHATLEDWRDNLESRGLDALAKCVKEFSAPRLPAIKSDVPGKTLAVAGIDSVREEMKNGALAEIARFSRQEWQTGLQSIA